ncbi:MFS transporter [Streptomyces sp. NPDC056390]|uniref:MFS transporter n=1 Tax=Streptomyces sp. NPDC056390 TaxID=3345806 RepID=UPI0035DF59A7
MILWIACIAQFVVTLDVAIVNVALPAMQQGLDLSGAGQQWVVNAYAIGFAGLLLLGGTVADLIGVKRAFLAGLTLFAVVSLIGGLATSGTVLIISRAAQGVGAALLAPATLTLITTTFTEPTARTRALGAWSAVMAAGGASGAVIGGLLTQYAGWRWVMFVNVPVAVALGIAALSQVPAAATARGALRRLDIPGAVLATCGLAVLVFGIVSLETHAPTSPTVWAPAAAGLLLLGSFFAVESKVKRPLLPLRMLRMRSLVTANAVTVAMGASMFALWFILSLALQQVLGYSPVRAGLGFLPGTIGLAGGAQISTRVVGRMGPRRLLVSGLLLSTLGFWWFSGISSQGSYASDVLGPLFVTTLGLGLSMTPLTVLATTGVERADAGLASGLVNTSRQVGGALGLAVLASIAARTTSHETHTQHTTVQTALAHGYSHALLFAAVFTAVAAGIALLLPSPKDSGRRHRRG